MRKAIMALEGLEEVPVDENIQPTDDSLNTSSEVTELELQENDTQSAEDAVDEISDIQESVSDISDQLNDSVESGEGISEDAAKAVEIAVEHFCKRIGYSKKVMPSLEGFSDKQTNLEKTKIALENINLLNEKLSKALVITQEGFIDSVKQTISMLFETENKVLSRLKVVSAKYEKASVKEDDITNPAWGKYLKSDTDKFTAAEALKTLSRIEETANNTKLATSLKTLAKCIGELTKEVRSNWFVSNKADIENIENINETVNKEFKIIDDLFDKKSKSKSNIFEPIDKKDVNKISTEIKNILGNKALNTELAKLNSESSWLFLWSNFNNSLRLKTNVFGIHANTLGWMANLFNTSTNKGNKVTETIASIFTAEDIRKAVNITGQIYASVKEIREIISTKIKVCSALVSYMEASIA